MKRLTDAIPGVSDSETRIAIWDRVPGNSGRLKIADMRVDTKTDPDEYARKVGTAIVGGEYRDEKTTLDTFTYFFNIKRGYATETYSDEPYIIPYISGERRPCVIVVPGGGYCNVTSDGAEYEGRSVALELNEHNISAVVLHYRINPYCHPLPLLDLQRAVRFLRKNADELNIDPDNIALIGFSAGGYEIAGFLNLVKGKELFPTDYIPDVTDRVDDAVFAAGLVYPVINYRKNVPMLLCSYRESDVQNPLTLSKILDDSDAALHFNSADTPQFVTYGVNDTCVDQAGAVEYCRRAVEFGTDLFVLPVENADHGYSRDRYFSQFLDWLETKL